MKILLFGGTTEGRKLAVAYAKSPGEGCMHVCVATKYGADLLEESKNLIIKKGRMDEEEMFRFMQNVGFDICVDATHPYAVDVSRNIANACKRANLRLLKLSREDVGIQGTGDDVVCFDSVSDAVSFLSGTKGNIFITTGSKELLEFTHLKDYKSRCFVRVLPSEEVISYCMELGFKAENIYCMQGPFNRDLNLAMLKACNASFLVTKSSGNEGGFVSKAEAAEAAHTKLLVIGRPPGESPETYSLLETADILGVDIGEEHDERKTVYLVGTGCGNTGQLTLDAINAILDCDCVIGAERIIDNLTHGVINGDTGPYVADTACMISGILSGKDVFVSYDPGRISEYIREKKPEKVCLLYSGDIGFFSGAAGISGLPEDYRLKVIPGISSGVHLCDKLMIPWQDVRFVSCHGRKPDLAREIENNEKLLILLGREDDFGRICRILCKSGHEGSEVYTGERLSYDDEKISSGYAGEMKDISLRLPAVMLIIKH